LCYKYFMPVDLIVVCGLAAAITALVLVFAHRLNRTYLQDFVSYYYTFLLFRCPLALLGKPLTSLISNSMHLRGLQLDQFQWLMGKILIEPLWILSVFFLLKCIVAFLGKEVPRSVTAAYFLFWGGFLALDWMFLFRFFQEGRLPDGAITFENLTIWREPFVVLAIYAFGIVRSSSAVDGLRQRGLRTFAWIGFVSLAGLWVIILRSFSFNIPALVAAALPLPALFYLSSFLKKYAAQEARTPVDEAILRPAFAKYGITPREAEIIAQICAGRSNKAIAEALFISLHTVKRHVNQVYQKIGVKNRVQLANAVREVGKEGSSPLGG